MDIETDTKDWTWVLDRPCPDCGFDPAEFELAAVRARVEDLIARWAVVLARPGARSRPNDSTWSPVEYACHVRDVGWLFVERLRKTRELDDYRFLHWDQNQTAYEDNYRVQKPVDVTGQVAKSGRDFATEVERIQDPYRVAILGIAKKFTAWDLAAYAMHDLQHHLIFDVAG